MAAFLGGLAASLIPGVMSSIANFGKNVLMPTAKKALSGIGSIFTK
jgi:hypothetical protein